MVVGYKRVDGQHYHKNTEDEGRNDDPHFFENHTVHQHSI